MITSSAIPISRNRLDLACLSSLGVAVRLANHRHRRRRQVRRRGDLVGAESRGLHPQWITGLVQGDQGEARNRCPEGVARNETLQTGVGLG